MEIFQIIGLCIAATVLILMLKNQRPEIAIQISIVTGIIVLILVFTKISVVVDFLSEFTRKANIDIAYVSVIMKIIGIAYIAEFGAEICKDAGEGAIASKIELAGKMIIIILAVPVIASLLDMVVRIMP